MTTTKVYVGNLPYSTTDQQLIALFEGFPGLLNGSIITRGRFSLGFGFVDFDSPETATTAVESVKGKKIGTFGRSVVAELARERNATSTSQPDGSEELQIGEGGGEVKPARGRSFGRGGGGGLGLGGGGRGRGGGRSRGGNRGRGRGPPGRGRNMSSPMNKTQQRGGFENNDDPSNYFAKIGRPTPPLVRKQRAPREPGPPSKTTLHVANLPWSFTNEDLGKIFEGTNYKSVRVVEFRGKSRGYGFVEFENEDDQKAALESKKDLEVEDKDKEKEKRKIKVSVSTAHPAREAEGEQPAASTTSTTTTPTTTATTNAATN